MQALTNRTGLVEALVQAQRICSLFRRADVDDAGIIRREDLAKVADSRKVNGGFGNFDVCCAVTSHCLVACLMYIHEHVVYRNQLQNAREAVKQGAGGHCRGLAQRRGHRPDPGAGGPQAERRCLLREFHPLGLQTSY